MSLFSRKPEAVPLEPSRQDLTAAEAVNAIDRILKVATLGGRRPWPVINQALEERSRFRAVASVPVVPGRTP